MSDAEKELRAMVMMTGLVGATFAFPDNPMGWTLFWEEQPAHGLTYDSVPMADAPLELYTLILLEMVEQRPETFPLISSAFLALTVEFPQYRSVYDLCERTNQIRSFQFRFQ